MTLLLSIIGMLILLVLMSLAWRKRPTLGFGIVAGVISVCVIGAVIQPSGLRHVPVWLPALPFAVFAVVLLVFGVLAWRIGRRRETET